MVEEVTVHIHNRRHVRANLFYAANPSFIPSGSDLANPKRLQKNSHLPERGFINYERRWYVNTLDCVLVRVVVRHQSLARTYRAHK